MLRFPVLERLGTAGVSIVAIILLTGCATNATSPASGGVDNAYPLADSEAAFGQTQPEWNTPFWKRWTADDKARDKSRASGISAQQAAPAAMATPVAAQTASLPQASAGSQLRPKVGVYVDGEERHSLVAYRFVNALARHADANGVTIIKPDTLRDAAQSSDICTGDTPIGCGQALAIYPGVRALVVVRPNKASSGNRMIIHTRMLDTDFGVDYEATDTVFGEDRAFNSSDLAAWSNRILGLVHDRIAIAPWFTHSFAREGQNMYVSAGRNSGLTAGSVLTVRDDGSIVRSPGGQVVAWKPGETVGEIRIKQLIGSQLAVAEHVSGRMPLPGDKLMAR